MKYFKRAGIYKASNVTFDPSTITAYSYNWWKFVGLVEGKVIFNNYSYSVSTSKHQSKVRQLLATLGVKIDLELPLPKGVNSGDLANLFETAEEYLCDKFLLEELKKEERAAKAKLNYRTKKLSAYLENVCHFRDYIIKAEEFYIQDSDNITHNHYVDIKDISWDVENALSIFGKQGFSRIVFYV